MLVPGSRLGDASWKPGPRLCAEIHPEGYWTVWEGVLAMWEPPRSTGLESSSLPLAKLLPSCPFRPFLEVSLTFLKEAPGFYSTLSLAS